VEHSGALATLLLSAAITFTITFCSYLLAPAETQPGCRAGGAAGERAFGIAVRTCTAGGFPPSPGVAKPAAIVASVYAKQWLRRRTTNMEEGQHVTCKRLPGSGGSCMVVWA